MTITAIKEKLHAYVDSANDADAVDLLKYIEDEMVVSYDHRSDDAFWDEMDRRVDELKTGKVKGVSWEEFQENAKKITG